MGADVQEWFFFLEFIEWSRFVSFRFSVYRFCFVSSYFVSFRCVSFLTLQGPQMFSYFALIFSYLIFYSESALNMVDWLMFYANFSSIYLYRHSWREQNLLINLLRIIWTFKATDKSSYYIDLSKTKTWLTVIHIHWDYR